MSVVRESFALQASDLIHRVSRTFLGLLHHFYMLAWGEVRSSHTRSPLPVPAEMEEELGGHYLHSWSIFIFHLPACPGCLFPGVDFGTGD